MAVGYWGRVFGAELSVWHWLVAIGLVFWTGGACRLVKRLGYSPWWGLLAIIPFWLPVGIWLLLANRWPIEELQVADIFDGEPERLPAKRLRRGVP
ncbi:MAG: hypothetical protein V4527_18385 [Pseudomonadota bacterium]